MSSSRGRKFEYLLSFEQHATQLARESFILASIVNVVWEEGRRHAGRSACVYSVCWAALDKCNCVCMCVSVLDHFHLVYCAPLSVFDA